MRSTPRSRRFGLAVAAIAALSVGLSGLAQASPPQDQVQAQAVKAQAVDKVVTLVTGDRITLYGGDPARAAVKPGPGRDGITFSTQRTKNHLYVVPSDVQDQLTSSRLDRRLFDVTGLIKAGYDDKSTSAIPVVVTYAGKTRSRSAAPGATVTRQLPVVNGAAMKVDKAKAATFLTGVTSARSAAGVEKIWLDGKREISLDQSVPQIGAPAAWQAGYTGKGVSVAVLDTGIDKSHPDLASQVAGGKNFTEESDEDLVGHGTHVASTIAGTAAASNGKYKGVAPDAKLYDGKVCEQGGCPESAILGGMEWAANEVKAKVVNLSLGGTDTPEVDPLEEAVNRLTAQTGTLFVIAAGNDGPGEGTVGSPGSADAALTVGAVDKQDKLAEFSSRGPRVGDGAVKPDVTAPGVDIVAAKAAKSIIGEPVGDKYLTLSGTSMATPHTVGAAALLAQEHPNWKAGELKGALMASAKPAADQTAFQQGAGRIDVAKGIKQSVITEPGSVSFGTAIWPHDDDTPVTKTLTYRNLGDQPVTLNLTATLAGPDGAPAPADAIKLSATTVTVPAGGTASVQATSNTNHSGPDGGYSGRITATGGDTTVQSAIGVNKEKESYDLTINNVGIDGKPALAFGLIFGLDTDVFTFIEGPTTKLRLPKGEYAVEGSQPGEGSGIYSLVQPSVPLTKNTTVVLDARAAKPVKVTVPRADAALALGDLGYDRTSADGRRGLGSSLLLGDFTGVYSAQVGPALPPEQMTGHVASQWAKLGANQSFANSPYFYGQVDATPGVYPTGLVRDVKAKELAVIDQTINATSDRQMERTVFGSAPHMGGSWAIVMPYDVPANTKLLVDDKPASWQQGVAEVMPNPDPENPFPIMVSRLSSPVREYKAGKTYRERFNAAALTSTPEIASRLEDYLLLSAYSLSDADGNKGFGLMDSQSSKLIRDGKVVAESPYFGYIETDGLPAEKATYTLETSQTRQTYSTFSTRTDLSWTFSSAATAKETSLPMLGVRYQPTVDSHNVAERKPVTVLPVVVDGVPGQALPVVKKLEIQYSGDDGKTWQKAAVAPTGKGTYKAIFATPQDAKTVSLKAHLIDAEGNVTDQTVIGAYPLR
ncbi:MULTISPECIES: S8 family serine peptidase [unclassified Kribbella]|uniref:S8 family serine peptidase n=1 Tax=unclassified Kribbella TaxID=2644121 RepID=UPI003015DC37